ncbi:MAG TPA: transposase [Patescibacteria group bacterium]|nr:transposase [Patescibacteria group bacterium]
MVRRKDPLVDGEVYHIFDRSIADFVIFNNREELERMRQLIKYYQTKSNAKFSDFIESKIVERQGFNNAFNIISEGKENLVQIIAYCLMSTHIHLILKQLKENGISDYMRKILESYSSYFNAKHRRKGPLWESKFKNVLVTSEEQLLHLTRYVHLNPVTALLVNKPEDWVFSSYNEYLYKFKENSAICKFDDILEIKQPLYRKFVNNRISYQRELAKIKNLILD